MKRSLLIPLAAFALTNAHAQSRPAAEQALARAIYKEFIEVQSGFTTGSTTPVARAAEARLKAAGFPAADIHVDGPAPNKLNLVVRYHGTGARKPILLLAHTDVVEAKREDWSMDPFQLIEKDGYFYGRGVGDDKAQAAIWIANLIQYKKEGFKPDRDLIVALTADEEGGGPFNGVDWLLKNHRDWIDADFALNEGGWGESVNGKPIANDLQLSEKWVLNVRLEVHNKGGHSSCRQVDDNAIYHLAGALERIAMFKFPLKTNAVTAEYFKQMAKTESGATKADLEQVAAGSQAAIASESQKFGQLECHASGHDVHPDDARGRPRVERSAAARRCDGELSRPAGGWRRLCEERAGQSHRGYRGFADRDRDAGDRAGIADESRRDASNDRSNEADVAGGSHDSDDGDGRDRRTLTPRGRDSDVRRSGDFY